MPSFLNPIMVDGLLQHYFSCTAVVSGPEDLMDGFDVRLENSLVEA